MITAVIDCGHGGDDPGAIGKTLDRNITENEVVLSIGKILESLIEYDNNLDCAMTRNDLNEKPTFKYRTKVAEQAYSKNPGKTFLLSIHADGFEQDTAQGNTLYHWPNSTLGIEMSYHLKHQLKFRPVGCRGIRENDKFKIIKLPPRTPSVLIETGFITNPGDARYLHSTSGRIETAQCIFRALKNIQEVIE